MRRIARLAVLVIVLMAARARAQPAGDPTPGTLAPLVVILNPMDGAVVAERIRLQARVHHPLGLDAVTAVTLSVSGAGGSTVALARNARYTLGDQRAIYEALLTLEPGSHALVATATDAAGRSTRSAAVTVQAHVFRGDGNLLVTDDSSQLCTACHADAVHGSEATGRAHGAWSTTCRDCHAPHDTVNASLIRETIEPPWLVGAEPPSPRPVRFATRAGYSALGGLPNPFWATYTNGDASGPCQVCHTRTARWRAGGEVDDVHQGDCTFCHRHAAGLTATCDECQRDAAGDGGARGARRRVRAGASLPERSPAARLRQLPSVGPQRHGDGASQVLLNPSLALRGGTLTSGASASGSGSGTTCVVACHFPLGSPTPGARVAWSTVGPLPCTSCHARIDPTGVAPTPRAGPSLHDPIFSEARPASGEPTTCYSCHASGSHDATHLTGSPGLAPSAAVNAVCIACHTPPSGPSAGAPGQVLHAGADARLLADAARPPWLDRGDGRRGERRLPRRAPRDLLRPGGRPAALRPSGDPDRLRGDAKGAIHPRPARPALREPATRATRATTASSSPRW